MRALLAVFEQGRNDALRFGCRTGSSTNRIERATSRKGSRPFALILISFLASGIAPPLREAR